MPGDTKKLQGRINCAFARIKCSMFRRACLEIDSRNEIYSLYLYMTVTLKILLLFNGF